MELGNFSISLNVEDMDRSLAFYQDLGFEVIAGIREQNWQILRNGSAIIGLFENMLESNILTFNPVDVRAIQKELDQKGVMLSKRADENTTGPEHILLQDPDGNTILIDQH